jgi:hypothetical protein
LQRIIDVDPLHPRRRRPAAAAPDESLDGSGIARDEDLDCSVAAVPHPAAEAERVPRVDGPGAVEDALDPAMYS